MPFTWQININKNSSGTGFHYDPNPLQDVASGDQIIWTNNTDHPHWPCIAGNQNAFMAQQIAPHSPSSTFIPGSAGPVSYIDFLNPTAPGGSFNVTS